VNTAVCFEFEKGLYQACFQSFADNKKVFFDNNYLILEKDLERRSLYLFSSALNEKKARGQNRSNLKQTNFPMCAINTND
jgi:hypothetical protein